MILSSVKRKVLLKLRDSSEQIIFLELVYYFNNWFLRGAIIRTLFLFNNVGLHLCFNVYVEM